MLKNVDQKRSVMTLVLAFAAVYIIWGSTYLAIKYAIETLPTFLMAGVRFMIAGSMLYTWARLSKDYEKPKLVHWRTGLIVGTLLLAVGNGGVVLAEHYIPSSLAALLVATEPFWIVVLGWLFMGSRLNLKVIAGLALGFIGVYMLIAGRDTAAGQSTDGQLFGIVLIIAATLGWAAGSLYVTRAPTAPSPIMAAAMQMLSGGSVLLVIGTLTGEWSTFNLAAVSLNSWLALAYLIIFGAVVAYTAYSWLLQNVAPSALSTYAYVNPAIAVLLGWAIAGESLTTQMLVGAGIVVASVALITMNNSAPPPAKREPELHNTAVPRPDLSTAA